ncbi:MAG: hypothetical protein PHE17_12085 [Thiothrix sp.]|uniref:hypothetical protein n=1 Tax=Thiothrix sp. TaxID=1032 RepID=UPI0026239378|nr:hypothetical protein [Thiothrix sp.]MDD5393749.1 hypothetical protein [Thiothrix sp.]
MNKIDFIDIYNTDSATEESYVLILNEYKKIAKACFHKAEALLPDINSIKGKKNTQWQFRERGSLKIKNST